MVIQMSEHVDASFLLANTKEVCHQIMDAQLDPCLLPRVFSLVAALWAVPQSLYCVLPL